MVTRIYWINSHLAGGSIPEKEDYYKLKELNITTIVSLVEDWEYEYYTALTVEEVYEIARNLDIKIFRYPTKDGYAPDEETLLRICDIICNLIDLKEKVYVHCVGGLGRTPTVLSAYLIYTKHITCEDALREIMNVNPDISITEEQYYALKAFELYVRNLKR